MKNLTEILNSYHEYHTKRITAYTHMVGVPIIIFSLMLVLSWFSITFRPVFTVSIMWLVIAAVSIYYIKLDLQLGAALCIIFICLGLLAVLVSHYTYSRAGLYVFLVTFILGWIIQFIGHYFEQRKPAFLDNLMQVFAAPIFVLAELLVRFGYRRDLSWIVKDSCSNSDVWGA